MEMTGLESQEEDEPTCVPSFKIVVIAIYVIYQQMCHFLTAILIIKDVRQGCRR
jgi:hypothetical protein